MQKTNDNAHIGKFISLWPTGKSLHGWIPTKWKPKVHCDLQLVSKVFFKIIFPHLDKIYKVDDRGPYFLKVVILYLRKWVERFNRDKEEFSWDSIGI